MEYVSVQFSEYDKKYYDFKTDLTINIGDTVVCDTVNGFVVGKVKKITKDFTKATKWVVCRVDVENHQKRLEHEKELKILAGKMEKRRKELEDISVYQILAKEDEEMASLLEEYRKFQSN